MLLSRITRTAAAATVALAVAAPAAQAGQDLRSPDTRDAAEHTRPFYYSFYGSDATHVQDLRSPDTRDAAEHYVPPTATSPRVVRISAPGSTGFDWTDAAIGAGTSFGLMLLVAGGVTVITRRRIIA
jgi:hypothetical protein